MVTVGVAQGDARDCGQVQPVSRERLLDVAAAAQAWDLGIARVAAGSAWMVGSVEAAPAHRGDLDNSTRCDADARGRVEGRPVLIEVGVHGLRRAVPSGREARLGRVGVGLIGFRHVMALGAFAGVALAVGVPFAIAVRFQLRLADRTP